jgi:hypothetical protein
VVRAGLLAAAFALAAPAHAATYLVRPDGTGDFPTIDAAIQYAQDQDVILLDDGTFTGPGNRDLSFHGKAITIRSASGTPETCVIDCQGWSGVPHRGISAIDLEGPGSVLSGLTIRNGYDLGFAGGLLCVRGSPTITDCVFRNCYGYLGGAVACQGDAAPVFRRCRFEADTAAIGGAIAATDSTTASFIACTFTHNGASIEAGAISLQYRAALTATDCVFEDNRGVYRGGALLADDWTTPVVTRCTFVGNASIGGGGAYCCAGSHGIFVGCTFQANAAPQGAQLCCGCSGVADLDHCILTFGVHGPAVYCWSSGQAHLACCDVYGNAAGDWVGYIAPQYGTAGNFSADPLFCDPGAGDLTLHAGSPCLAGHHPPGDPCGLIGAWGLGCPTEDAPDGPEPLDAARLAIAGANPFAGSTWIWCRVPDAGGAASLAVFDPAGRRVRSLAPGGLGSGTHRVPWDGTDDLGHPVAAGVYLVQLRYGGRALDRSICRVR